MKRSIWLCLAALAAACVDTTTEEAAGGLPSVAQALSENSTCVTFQRSAQGAVQDAHISSHQPAHTAGEAPELYVGQAGRNQRQGLLRFDIGSVPSEAIVTSATLRVWRNPSSALATPGVHAITSAWQEDTVSWSSFRAGFAPQTAARMEVSSRHAGALSANLTSLVRSWVRSPSLNHGLLLEQASGHSLLASSESTHSARRPSLEVCYFVPESVPQSTSLLVRVLDADGAPLRAAAVSVNDSLHTTDGAGYLFLDGLAAGRFLARVNVQGFAPATVVANLRTGLHASAEVRLLPLGPPLPFDAKQGATLERQGVRVTIPPDGVVYPNGQPASGLVELTIVPLDPTQGLATLPGPLEGVTASSGQHVPLESFFMAELSLSQYGVPLQLAPGASAVVEFPLSERAARGLKPGDSVPAWWFDLDAGVWREEGVGLIQASQSAPGQLSWVAELHHFTWWNADAPWDERSCVNVLVQAPNGAPVANVPVTAVGTSYTGTSLPSYTGADGRACVDIKKGATADIFVGLPGNPVSAVVSVTGSATPSACAFDNTGCVSITLQVSNAPVCVPGSFDVCPNSGNGIGMCQPTRRWCGTFGLTWTDCNPGDVFEPVEPDTCTSLFDDDCDGVANEDCICQPNTIKDCYTGPPDTADVGICEYGTQACADYNGDGGVELGQCLGEVLPGTETCATVDDDDCDGSTQCDDLIEWGRRFGDAQCQESWGIATSGQDIFVTGWLKGTMNFGGAPLSSPDDDIFVARLNPQGNHLWSQSFTGPGLTVPVDIATDNEGNLLIAIVFVNDITIAGQSFVSPGGSTDTLVVKLSPEGVVLWARHLTGPVHQEARSIATDQNRDVLVTGLATGSLTVGTTTVPKPTGNMFSFVLKLNADSGALMWVQGQGGTDTTVGLQVVADTQGDVVVAGGFAGDATFNLPQPAPTVPPPAFISRSSAGSYDAFVAKFSGATGNPVWVRTLGNPHSQFATGVATVGTDVVFTGAFEGNVTIDGVTLTNASQPPQPPALPTADGFLIRLDAMGNHAQSRKWGGTGDDEPLAIAVDGAGGLVLSGLFDGTTDFGGGPRTANSALNFFLARYDSSFNHLWSQGYPGAKAQRIHRHDLAFDSNGQVLFTGSFQGTIELGNGLGTLTSEGCNDALVLKVRPIP